METPCMNNSGFQRSRIKEVMNAWPRVNNGCEIEYGRF